MLFLVLGYTLCYTTVVSSSGLHIVTPLLFLVLGYRLCYTTVVYSSGLHIVLHHCCLYFWVTLLLFLVLWSLLSVA